LHFKIDIGETVVTSGYSAIFPENFVIGTISAIDPNNQDGFYDIQVRLATDFSTLDHLYLVQHERKAELDSLRNLFNYPKK
ncbi:MAG: rod shape-determining protein MreC, partial [Bacteroidia bacterium]|nr:rod shape-determining protein MreC [Bacteroidia bacterium]